MRPVRPLLPAVLPTLLALSISACQSTPATVGNGNLNIPTNNGNITPSPNGPRPVLNPGDALANGSLAIPRAPSSNNKSTQYDTGVGGAPISATQPAPMPNAVSQPLAAPGAGSATSVAAPQHELAPEPTPTPSPDSSATPASDATPAPNPLLTDFFYFSYDDSASTAGVEQTKYALKHNQMPQPSWVRPWEFLSYESFDHAKQQPIGSGKFKVSMGMWQHGVPGQQATAYDLGVHVTGPEIKLEQRRNLNLTIVLDVSGSMDEASEAQIDDNSASQTKLAVAKAGLRQLPTQLKQGDVINLVTFSDDAKVLIKNWTYSGNPADYLTTVDKIATEASTNLDAGLTKGYELAKATFSKDKINRVVMMTDAFANQGQTKADVIRNATRINDAEGIYFSGLGFGAGFNEAFLDELTEAGKGTYFSVISKTDATRAFGERFMSLVNIAAENVRFRLDYPALLKHSKSQSEQASQNAADVQPIHFSYNTSQYFLEQFKTSGETTANSGSFKLTIDYTDPISHEQRSEVYEQTLEQVRNQDLANIKDARVISLLAALIRGQTSSADGKRELDELLNTHTSRLATEYKAYIQTWLGMQTSPPVQPLRPPQPIDR